MVDAPGDGMLLPQSGHRGIPYLLSAYDPGWCAVGGSGSLRPALVQAQAGFVTGAPPLADSTMSATAPQFAERWSLGNLPEDPKELAQVLRQTLGRLERTVKALVARANQTQPFEVRGFLSGDVTVTSNTYVDTGLSFTFVCPMLATGVFIVGISALCNAAGGLTIGVSVNGGPDGNVIFGNFAVGEELTMSHIGMGPLSAATSYTYKLRAKVSGAGSYTLRGAPSPVICKIFVLGFPASYTLPQ